MTKANKLLSKIQEIVDNTPQLEESIPVASKQKDLTTSQIATQKLTVVDDNIDALIEQVLQPLADQLKKQTESKFALDTVPVLEDGDLPTGKECDIMVDLLCQLEGTQDSSEYKKEQERIQETLTQFDEDMSILQRERIVQYINSRPGPDEDVI